MSQEIKKKIGAFISGEFLEDEMELTYDTRLMELAILDSFSTIKLIGWLETSFSIQIDSKHITAGNFASITTISELVEQIATATA